MNVCVPECKTSGYNLQVTTTAWIPVFQSLRHLDTNCKPLTDHLMCRHAHLHFGVSCFEQRRQQHEMIILTPHHIPLLVVVKHCLHMQHIYCRTQISIDQLLVIHNNTYTYTIMWQIDKLALDITCLLCQRQYWAMWHTTYGTGIYMSWNRRATLWLQHCNNT